MKAQLASMWSPCRRTGNLRRLSARSSLLSASDAAASSSYKCSVATEEDAIEMKVEQSVKILLTSDSE